MNDAENQAPGLSFRDEWLPLLLLLAAWGLGVAYLPHLPQRMPVHWGIDGKPNGWMEKPWGALIGPIIYTLVYAILVAVPFLDPRRRDWTVTMRMYPVIKDSLMAFFLLVTYLSLSAAADPAHHLQVKVLIMAIGLLFVVLGNYLPKARSNFFVGVRTPWTLSNEVVWERTNKVFGRGMLVGGILIASSAAFSERISFTLVMAEAALLLFGSLGYSWWLYQKVCKPLGSAHGPRDSQEEPDREERDQQAGAPEGKEG